MELAGIDLSALRHEEQVILPDAVPGRVLHIDADFLAYQTSAQGKGEQKTFEDMKHNAEVIVAELQALAGATAVHLHLTPSTSSKGNRRNIALLKGYQLNRVGKEHPQYLGIMRVHLADKFPGTLHQECEADDGMSSSQYESIGLGNRELSVICSKDKDLAMVPGLHLDWDYGTLLETESDYGSIRVDRSKSSPKCVGLGQKFFWAQMLMGDTADNISGLPGICLAGPKPKRIGPVLAVDLLSDIRSNRDAFEYVKSAYAAYGQRVGYTNYRDGTSVPWQNAFLSEAKLLWMRRNRNDPNDVVRWFKEITA